jgi:cadmium resistance protein CadD (predicted permease)
VHTIFGVVVVASFAFIGTMLDNFFAFAAQLVVTDRVKFRRVGWAQAIGVAAHAALAAGVGSVLAPIPLAWIGILAVAPIALGVHAWRQRHRPRGEQFRRGTITTFTVTLALGGDNLAVWIPLLRANGFVHAMLTVATFAVWEIVFIVSAQRIASHPRIVTWGARHAPLLTPWIYLALGILVLFECGIL